MAGQPDSPISLGERLAMAFASATVVALTLLVLPWGLSIGSNAGEPLALYLWIFSKAGLVIIAAAALAGFILGAERMVNVLSFFWGTHPVWEEDGADKAALAVAIAILFGWIAYRLWMI